ncbi:MAG TPA: hypothetical protein VNL35_07505 [Chloroflexota bacterium]|nr:hypothetical protein [Chloroflexota bacterium]
MLDQNCKRRCHILGVNTCGALVRASIAGSHKRQDGQGIRTLKDADPTAVVVPKGIVDEYAGIVLQYHVHRSSYLINTFDEEGDVPSNGRDDQSIATNGTRQTYGSVHR